MREILFRGQTRKYGKKVNMKGEKLPGKWVYGGILQGTGDFSVIYGYDSIDENGIANLEKHVVYTDTVGQYTGLDDKNGTKIFEGDIVSFQHPFQNRHGIYLVSFLGSGFNCESFYQSHFDNPYDAFSEGTDFFEVIGNIHDTPELVKGV